MQNAQETTQFRQTCTPNAENRKWCWHWCCFHYSFMAIPFSWEIEGGTVFIVRNNILNNCIYNTKLRIKCLVCEHITPKYLPYFSLFSSKCGEHDRAVQGRDELLWPSLGPGISVLAPVWAALHIERPETKGVRSDTGHIRYEEEKTLYLFHNWLVAIQGV